jgi:hypothetical protein
MTVKILTPEEIAALPGIDAPTMGEARKKLATLPVGTYQIVSIKDDQRFTVERSESVKVKGPSGKRSINSPSKKSAK